jgi:hypothetical protein
MWIGAVLLADTLGLLEAIQIPAAEPLAWIPFLRPTVWSLILTGIGTLFLLEVLLRMLFPAYRTQVFGALIGAVVMFGLVFGLWTYIVPVVLIAVGLNLLMDALMRRGRDGHPRD